MSALASGFPNAEQFYNVVPPTPRDLGEPFVGACYQQRADICWIPNRAYSKWVVTAINGDIVTLAPLLRRTSGDIRKMSTQILKTEYKLCAQQRQRPGCQYLRAVICIIAGCRYIKNYSHIEAAVLESGFDISQVVSGGASGVDTMAVRWAKKNNKEYKVFPAKWAKHGRSAGPIRNKEMARYSDGLIAIWDGKSKGTKNMIQQATLGGLNLHVYRCDVNWWVSSNRMTFGVTTVDNIIIDAAPIGKKFIGQHLVNLLKWMKKQGGLKVSQYDSK